MRNSLPTNARWIEGANRICYLCGAKKAVGILKSDRNDDIGPVCAKCGDLAILRQGKGNGMNPIDRLSWLKLQVSQHTWAEIEQAVQDIAALRSDRDALAARLAEGEKVIRPFADYYRLNDLDERAGSETLEVPVRDLRAARSFLTPTGEGKL